MWTRGCCAARSARYGADAPSSRPHMTPPRAPLDSRIVGSTVPYSDLGCYVPYCYDKVYSAATRTVRASSTEATYSHGISTSTVDDCRMMAGRPGQARQARRVASSWPAWVSADIGCRGSSSRVLGPRLDRRVSCFIFAVARPTESLDDATPFICGSATFATTELGCYDIIRRSGSFCRLPTAAPGFHRSCTESSHTSSAEPLHQLLSLEALPPRSSEPDFRQLLPPV